MGLIHLKIVENGKEKLTWVGDFNSPGWQSYTTESGVKIFASAKPIVDLKEKIKDKIDKIPEGELHRLDSILDRGGFLPLGVSEEEFNSRDC